MSYTNTYNTSRYMAVNPFRYGALALDESFADRERELAELLTDVLNGQDVVIFAPRRFGKSSLVWRAQRELLAKGHLVAHVDLMTTATKEKLAEKLASSIYENIASPLERAKDRALAPFRGLRAEPTISISPEDGSLSFSFGVSRAREDIDATLERLLQLPGELGSARGRGVALVIDEFQEIVEIDPDLPKLLRSVFQTQPEVSHVYLGSRRHIMERIFSDSNEPFWRSAKSTELGPIAPDLFAPFIAERFRASGRRIAPQCLGALLDLTGGHPYATQELAYFLWEQVDEGGEAAGPDLDVALDAVLQSENAHFQLIWERASSVQKLVLAALAADSPARPFSQDYRRRHELPAATNLQKALGALVQRELVATEKGAYWIAEPFLSQWIATRIG